MAKPGGTLGQMLPPAGKPVLMNKLGCPVCGAVKWEVKVRLRRFFLAEIHSVEGADPRVDLGQPLYVESFVPVCRDCSTQLPEGSLIGDMIGRALANAIDAASKPRVA